MIKKCNNCGDDTKHELQKYCCYSCELDANVDEEEELVFDKEYYQL